jgi:hypothetical protein
MKATPKFVVQRSVLLRIQYRPSLICLLQGQNCSSEFNLIFIYPLIKFVFAITDVLTAVLMKIAVFLNKQPCSVI